MAQNRVALREPQQDRSRVTRARLLESAVSCLAELGWNGATVTVVAEHAGVSRGATQHYFPTREDLFIAALEHMAEVRLAEIRSEAGRLPAGAAVSTRDVVGLLVRLYTGPLFRAALQLWAAASASEALREQVMPLEARLGREAHRAAVELLGARALREEDRWSYELLRARGNSIEGGTTEVLKNIVAERVLGLPRLKAATA